jgi:hypothetical protein
MVRGLGSGEADRDQDGYVDLDELYDYVYDAVREVTPHQTPGKWTFGVQGDLVIARRSTAVTEPVALPPEIQQSLDSSLAGVRAGAVDELARLLSGRHQGLSLAARRALEALLDDDSRSVAASASAALGATSTSAPPDAGLAARADTTAMATVTGAALRSPTPTTAGQPPDAGTATTRSRPRGWQVSAPRRLLLAGAVAVLLVGGLVTWRVVDQAAHSSTIPASFDGRWVGEGVTTWHVSAVFTATLREDLRVGRLASDESSCYGGPLTVSDATDSRLTTRFDPDGQDCNPWTVEFTHASGGALRMAVNPDSNVDNESEFEVRLTRQG